MTARSELKHTVKEPVPEWLPEKEIPPNPVPSLNKSELI